ncbi:TPA: type IV secretion system DNA-binding domain-containing protein [Vibrio parahaemolyticus]|uniref:type IV secretion system DNA-binding domain-containing protein n=1 Tax=Vibrio alginolyticus TaxID=663 RepID=UPI001EEA1430|nr:type IV secretion system DNA-binding domain-containing protein [Vibrio alginolyticus]MCG6322509.1 type IV secretion system DNA-binding domain-containing protein [Vibrio alginolyticus]HCE2669738.1 type IV secretion system DNA-binding domain-containing protein [Vibrio parahaemolyticus]HCE4613551.1 type IV secretion system DNA-binding domain-containing protein [Vibrio parahaemolyticus]HCG8761935.1 type IV secretion system DNA-binding domain-containing protein [Vibrio parahaemolyticus]
MIASTQRYQLWPQMLLFFICCSAVISYMAMSIFIGRSWNLEDKLTNFRMINLEEVIILSVSLLTSALLTFKLIYVSGGREPVIYLDGPKRINRSKVRSHAKKLLKRQSKNDAMGKGVFLHPDVQISKRTELGNVLIFGQQGSGKSTVIKPIIDQIVARKDLLFIYDRKNEYTPLFLDSSSILINPCDKRSFHWDIGSDVRSEQDAFLVAQCLIEETTDPLWSTGARLILTGLFIILINTEGKCSWHSIAKLLSKTDSELQPLIQMHYPQASVFINQNSKTTQGFLVTLVKELHWVRQLGVTWKPNDKNKFSVRRWAKGNLSNANTLILAHDENASELSMKLCSAMFSLMVSAVLALEDSSKRRIWFSLDELSSLQKNDALEKWLRLGRSKGARTIAGVQALSQIKDIYGADVAETIFSLFGSIIALRMGATGESAKYASATFGERQVERQIATLNSQGERTMTCQVNLEPLVRADELINLEVSAKGVSGLLLVQAGSAVYELVWKYPDIPKVAKPKIAVTKPQNRPTTIRKVGKNNRLRRNRS